MSCGRTAKRELAENQPPRSGAGLATVGIVAGYLGIAVGVVSLLALLAIIDSLGGAWD
ncbi:hypothetical protein [Demequina sp. SO4-18]|uniref:hypothetical protein n=1 Tax=Demequina sp. SO4-18 TaxID=3401026 RepID=UPI003B5CC32C